MAVRAAALAFVAALALGASPARPELSPETAITVTLANFHFTPSTITLVHGQPYVLELVNAAGGGHNFVAPRFFSSAAIAPADRARIAKGTVEVHGGERVTIHFVAPAAGRYPLKCSHLFHSTLGMTGTIAVS